MMFRNRSILKLVREYHHNLSDKFVSILMNDDQKQIYIKIAEGILFNANEGEKLPKIIIIGGETCIYGLDTKRLWHGAGRVLSSKKHA